MAGMIGRPDSSEDLLTWNCDMYRPLTKRIDACIKSSFMIVCFFYLQTHCLLCELVMLLHHCCGGSRIQSSLQCSCSSLFLVYGIAPFLTA